MSTIRHRSLVAACAVAGVILGSTLSGCSITRDDSAAPESASATENTSEPTEDATDDATEDATESPTTTSASPTPSPTTPTSAPADETGAPTPTEVAAPEQALLTAAQMPRLNRSAAWTERRTDVAVSEPFGLCQKYDLLSIGAMSVHERIFAHQDDSAGQQIAEFPDAQNAVRATKVLEAWHRGCARQVPGTQVNVRELEAVPVTKGKGWTYLVSYERRGRGHFHSLGMVLAGNRITLIRIDHEGQDHNYPPGREPTELAVKAASAKLG